MLKSYEIQNLKLSENERKLKSKLIKELKLMNQKDIHYKNEIEFLKQKISSYHKKLSIILGEDYIISNNNNNYEISQFSSNKKRSGTSKLLCHSLIYMYFHADFENIDEHFVW